MEREFINKKVGIVVSFGVGESGSTTLMSYEGLLMDVGEDYIKINVTGVEAYPISALIKFKQKMGTTIFKKKNVILMCEL